MPKLALTLKEIMTLYILLSCLLSCRAAFQYGVKMNDGRKTRRYGGLNDKAKEKAKLNREWQQISQVSDVGGSDTRGVRGGEG